MDDFYVREGVATFPEGVSEVPKYALEGRADIVEAVLPEGVESIGQCAFIGCENLLRARLPASLTHIGERAFEDCASLAEIDLPDNVGVIKRSAFYGCSSLKRAGLPASLKVVEEWAFAECPELADAGLPDGLLSVRDGAFANCASLKYVFLPAGVISIGKDAFAGCDSLRYLEFNLSGEKIRLELPPSKDGFAFFNGLSDKRAFVKYNRNNEVIIRKITVAGEKTFTTEAANAERNYGQYLSVESGMDELFNWLEIRDAAGSTMRRVTLPPVFVLSAIGYRDEDIAKFFRYRKPYFLRLCRSPRFAALNTEVKANVVKLFAVLGGFGGVNKESEVALSVTLDVMKTLGEDEIHRWFDGLPSGCEPAQKRALPYFIESIGDKRFLEVAARYVTEYQEINEDYRAAYDKMVERIRAESDEDARNLMKAKLKEFRVDVGFINRYIAKHRLHIRNRGLEQTFERYKKDITQSDVGFLDDLYERALKIDSAVKKGGRTAAKLSEPGVTDTRATDGGVRFIYRWADILDPDLYTLGYSTDCCFKPPDNSGAAVLGEAVVSADVWPLIIYDRENGPVAAFAIVNYNGDENGLLFDNIEVAPGYQRGGCDGEILDACIRGALDMRSAMAAKGRKFDYVNMKYDPFNDLNAEIERRLPQAKIELRCKIYIYDGYTYTSGGDRPQREIFHA